ncbi:M16 family metallopeptidase [Hyphococcus luteus]|uniref:Peptidase M16 n=1 Tax=Hyphococcus luteus TaxID=2058213 RepID=A0A2S7K9U7_9PROT|nr:pitrilysin family protein [Marinicaulis flavus]PQA89290.1 peptidase M16 [Marinicaulis flavus]
MKQTMLKLTKIALLAAASLAVLSACNNEQASTPKEAAAAAESAMTASKVDGVRFIEKVTRGEGDDFVIPYEKYALDNGLTVILHEDHSDPLVHVDVTYHVGSAREDIGKSGFAHFFEHMMFNGSENVADEEHFGLITEAGGTLNGTTNTDRTNYFETVPNNQLERMLWLEADRMGFLLPAVTQRKFEIQRATVKNERGQHIDNQPYGLVGEKLNEALYPEGHPYSWQTIGYMEDLDRVDVNDLKDFFLRWYGPNNAALTIGGDFDRDQALSWVAKYFGSIPRGPEVGEPEAPTFTINKNRYLSYEDNVALPLIVMSWPTTTLMDKDEAPLDVLMSIIGTGDTSLLYKNLVKNGLAVQAQAGHGCQELGCTFTVNALPNPSGGASLADLERIIRETFEEFEERGVSDADIDRFKMRIVAGKVFSLESVSGKVSQLAAYQTFFANPNLSTEDIARYETVTAEDVMAAYEKYLKGKPGVILSVLPKGKALAPAKPDNWTYTPRTLPEYQPLSENDLEFRMATDDFDRGEKPPVGPAPEIHTPPIWRDTTPNGIAVLGAENNETPTTALQLQIHIGQREEPLDKLGLTALTFAMLDEATTGASKEELSGRLQRLGSSVSIGAGDDYASLVVSTLTDNLSDTLDIAAAKLFSPAFKEDDFKRVKNQFLQAIAQKEKNPGALADDVRRLLIYGGDNAFANADMGTADTISAITLDDVKAFYEVKVRKARAQIVVVSDLPQTKLISEFSAFAQWKAGDAKRAEIHAFPALETDAIYLIDKPDAAQSEIRIARRAMLWDAAGEFYKANIMNFPLGGSFNSRINQNLREDKGYTYGARSGFGANDYAGAFTASAAVRANATGPALTEFFKELDAYRKDGATDEELAFAKNSIVQREALAYETPGKKIGFLSNMLTFDLEPDFVDDQRAALNAMILADVKFLARQYLDKDDMIVVIVGDRDLILNDLTGFGRRIIEIDASGAPMAAQ